MDSSFNSLVSVIIPVYNVEKYVRKCLDSILNQSYLNIEVIIVNDGSTDNSQSVCEEYLGIDERIRYIVKENGGLSDARNVGVNNSTGDYIVFIDGDDFISHDYIEYLYNLIKKFNADVSACNYQKLFANDMIKDNGRERIVLLEGKKAVEKLLYQKYFTMSAWGKMYKRDVVNMVEFPKGKVHEDVGTVYKYIEKSNRTVYSSKQKYGYVQREKSIINSKFDNKKMDYIDFTKEIIEHFKSDSENLYKAAVSRHFSACFQMVIQVPLNDHKYKSNYLMLISEINRYKKIVLLDWNARYINRIAAMLSCFSIEYTIKVLKIFKG